VPEPPVLNGSSGARVDANVLHRLGVSRANAWITDCLDTYRASKGVAAAIDSRFLPFAAHHGLPVPVLPSHPSEQEIVAEATQPPRLQALRQQLENASPEVIVTLGNAALEVMHAMLDRGTNDKASKQRPRPGRQLTDENYGTGFQVDMSHQSATWYPLCHPAAPQKYQKAHAKWAP
jgi:uracil-DNA glycosylase